MTFESMEQPSTPTWAVTAEKVEEAVRRLISAANPRKIILFGSRARGESSQESDLDLLIVKREVDDRVNEMIRLNRVLKGLILPVELVVVDEATFADLAETPGTVYFEAKREGKVLYESA